MDLPGRRARMPVPSTREVDGGIGRGHLGLRHLGKRVLSGRVRIRTGIRGLMIRAAPSGATIRGDLGDVPGISFRTVISGGTTPGMQTCLIV